MSLLTPEIDRRTLLKTLGGTAAALSLNPVGFASPPSRSRQFQGVFPIASSPFTPDDKLDLESLAAEVRFCNRARLPGIIWPQIASGWSTLTADERMAGAEAMLAAGKRGNTTVVIGVQTKGGDLAGAIAFAKHAAKNGADAICSLPPEVNGNALEYYEAIGSATDLPLFIQTIGEMSADSVAEMCNAIPTVRVIKDEAGDPLARVQELRAKTGDRVAIFAGKGVRQMMDEMRLGFTGFCPVIGLSDLFQQAWELWQAGKRRESYDMFGRILAFATITGADQYVMVARGIFKETTRSRLTPGMAAGNVGRTPLTDADKKNVRGALNTYLKPYLRG